MNKKKTLLISAGIVGILSVGALGLIGNYFYNIALNPNTSKDIIFGSPEEAQSTSGQVVSEAVDWFLNKSNYSDVNIEAIDNLKLHGYEISNEKPTNKWVIVVHGYGGKGSDMANFAKHYYDMGYNLLVPDLRGLGESEGDYIGMGWDDRLDIVKWIDLINKNNEDSEIILHGVSMGAATVSMTSGENLPSNVKAIIADCGYTSVWDEFSHQLKAIFSLPDFPVMNASSIVAKLRAGYGLKEASSLKQVAKSKTPILFIHGDSDDFVPYSMMDTLYNATNSEKEKLTIKGAGHGEASKVDPELYWSTVTKFISKYL